MTPTTVNAWIKANETRLKQRLNLYGNFNEDAFQDAYITIAQGFTAPEQSKTIELAFIEAYKKCSNRYTGETYTQSHPSEIFFALLPSDESEPMETQEEEKDHTSIAKRIQRHIRATFPRKEVMAFEMKMKGFSHRDITDAIGFNTVAIYNLTERIINQTRLQFATVAL